MKMRCTRRSNKAASPGRRWIVSRQSRSTEPHRFGEFENVLLAPHSIAWTNEMFRDIGRTACQGMVDLSLKRTPRGIVNPEVLERPGFQASGTGSADEVRHAASRDQCCARGGDCVLGSARCRGLKRCGCYRRTRSRHLRNLRQANFAATSTNCLAFKPRRRIRFLRAHMMFF